jgi:hypothetical protein
MTTHYVTVKGRIHDGQLHIALPDNVTDGEVEVLVPITADTTAVSADERPLTDDEIEALMQPNPKSGAEIIALGHTGGWEHKGIEDSVAWVKEQRRKRREKRAW